MYRKLIKSSLQLVFSLGTLLLFSSCGVLNVGNMLLSSGTLGSGADTGDSVEALSGAESNLFESGPVDIPVGVAKLDGLNSDLITATESTRSLSRSSDSRFLRTQALVSGEDIVTFDGAAGAADSASTSVLVINISTGEQETGSVDVDTGIFSIPVAGTLDDTFVLAGLTSDDLAASDTYATPPLTYSNQAGVAIWSNSNTDALATLGNITLDNEGSVYSSITNDDGTYTLFKQSHDGSFPDTVLANYSSPIRLITALSADIIVLLNNDGDLIRIDSSSSSASENTRFVTTSHFLTTYSDPVDIATYEDFSGIATIDDMPCDLVSMAARGYLIVRPPQDGDAQSLVDFYHADDTSVTILVPAIDGLQIYDDVQVAANPSGTVFVFIRELGELEYTLYKLDASLPNAWQSRTFIDTLNASVTHMELNLDSVLVFSARSQSDSSISYYLWDESDGIQEFYNTAEHNHALSHYFKVALNGKFIATCETETDTPSVIILPFTDELKGTEATLAAVDGCQSKSLEIDGDGNVFSYFDRGDGDAKNSQMSYISTKDLGLDLGTEDK